MARKPRVVPFVPFPRDGDLDGLVQDGTIWERPKGAYLRFIDTGEIWSEYGQVDRDRVEFVRADGSVWDFTPSFRDTDSTTLGGSLGTLADDSPSLLESQGMLPRGLLGPSLAESARFDDAVDDVDVVDVSTDKGSAALAAFRPKIEYLLSDEAVESGLITQASQDRLRGLNNIPAKQVAAIDIAARRNRITLFQYMEEQLHGKPTGRSGESPSYRYANFTLGESMAAMLRDGDRQSISLFRSRLKFLEDEARIRRRSAADIIEIVDEDDVRFLQAMAAALPVTSWHDHHIKELINAYAARDFDKVRYHADWLDRNTAPTGRLETQLDLAKQLQYMADNPELIDRLFLQTAGLKDYEYYTGHAFRRSSDSIGRAVASAKSDLAARRADEATELSSTLGIIPESRLVERAGELSGQYQDFDVISQVLRDIETAETAIQRLEDDGEHTLASQLRERLAELKTELKEVTKPQDIKVVFTEETLKDKKLQGILRFIPGGAENEDLLRKIKKSADGLSPEYRPTEIRIELLDNNKIGGTFDSATGVLVITPQMLGLDEHLIIDREAGTIKRFNPDDGPDGLDIPLGSQSLVTLGRLRNDFQEVGLSETPLDQVAVHEAVHRIDSLLAADAFFREKTRLEGEIENIQKQIDDPENARRVSILTETLIRRQEALRELDRQERDGDYIFRNDSPIRQAPQQWISENRPWLETYNRDFELRDRNTDHAYVSSILGYTPNDYLQIKYGVSKNTPGLDPLLKNRMERTESMEVLAEVISAHVTGRRRIPAGTDGEESNLPQMFDKYSKQIIPEELKFILTDRDWSEDDLPPLTALAGRQEADTAYSTDEARRVVRDVDQGKQRGSLLPRVASDPSATSQMLSDAESEDRKNRILGELAQAQVDEPELFRDGVLVDKVWAPFSPPPHLAGSGLRDELAEATSWREVSQLLKGKRVVVFDTETAGRMDPDEVDEDRIVQLGGVVYVDGVIVDRFSMYVNVDYDELSDWSQANLIDADGKPMSPEFLAKQPDMPTVLQEFMRFANGDSDGSDVVFMAHNAAFDLKRMELERQRHDPDGVPSFDLDEVTYFDTMGLGNIAKRAGIEDGPGSASLKKLQEFFGLEDFSWHTADADSEMTGQVLWRLLDYMDENDVPLDGLDPVAGLERQREEFAEYEGKIPEFLRQKERLAELRGLSDQLRSDRDDAVSSMIVMGAEGLDGGEEIPVRAGFYDDPDGYVPDPVTRDDIARQLGFADAGELDAATVDDPVMENNARILEELASYGFSLDAIDKVSGEDWQARYDASTPNTRSSSWGAGSPLDDNRLDSVFSDIQTKNEERIKFLEERKISNPGLYDTPGVDREIAFRKDFAEKYAALTLEERKQVVVAYMRDIFDDPDTTVGVSSDNVEDVYRDGMHKNIHFPGIKGSGGGGLGGPRSDTEAAIMGLHEQVPPELRPTYGYIVSGAQRRQARREALKELAPIRYQYGKVEFYPDVTDAAKDEIVATLMPEVLEELFPGAQKISELPNDADIETAVAALNDKIVERFGFLEYLTEDGRRRFAETETSFLNIGFRSGVMILDPKVLRRSSVSDGDSINNGGSPVPLSQDLTDQQLLDIVFKRSAGPKGSDVDPSIFLAAITGLDSTVLLRNLAGPRRDEGKPVIPGQHQYLETQIFGNFQSAEIIAAKTGRGLDADQRVGVPNLPDLTPESEVAAIKTQRAAERADEAGDEVASFMARSSDDIVPESTDIPGGGVFETDDGGFWVPGPPPVGFTEEAKVQWERGVELLRERPDLFKTQVIADDGLPVPEDERPGLADIGSVYDALPSADANAAMTVRREIEKAWKAEITRAIVLNKIDIGNPREVWGSDNDTSSEAWQRYGYSARAERGMWENLPQGLLHVTTGLSGLQDGGFKTRAQLSDESGEVPAGLGGGVDDAISFTTDPLVADSIVRGIHEMREAVRDDTGPAAVERMKSEIAAWTKSMPENERKKLLSATPSTMEERGDFYRQYSYWRQYNVPNRPDPLFWSPNYQAYADLDPNEVGVVTVNPSVDGARGWQVSGMGEWRTIPEAVEIVQSEARPTIVDDMTATLDELDTVRSSAPDFGLPPGPEKLTGWDKDRLTGASVPDIHEGKPRPVADVVDGVHLREDQKSLKTVVAELSTEDDLLPLQKKLEEAFELGGSLSGKQRTDATYEIFAAINDLITSRQRDTTGFTPSQMREYEKEVAENEEWVGSRIAKAIQIHWGEARSEVFHWDFLSERVKTVLGEEFGIDVSHEPSEIDAGIEEVFEIQELLTPFIDAWVRGQYSTTQKYLEDAGITELSVFRGTYIPNVVGDDDGLPSGREPSVTRGLESWSTDIGIALGFAGNKYGTADDRIEEMAEVGELGEPTHVLQHDVVPAQLIMGIGYLDNPRIITGSLGQGEESEIVVLGSSRPVNWLSNDLLKPWRSERPEGGYDFKIKEAAVFAYLSTGLWPKFS